MKKIACVFSLIFLSSCQWISQHSKEENNLLQLAEDVAHDMFVGEYPISK